MSFYEYHKRKIIAEEIQLPAKIKEIESGYRTPKVGIYKNYKITAEPEIEDDNIKWFHSAEDMSTGKVFHADINPYDSSLRVIALWIEAGMPVRSGLGPLHKEDLERMIAGKGAATTR